jgi:sulfite exporter TauE/SafE
MLASIHPLGERARHNRFWITATTYIAGSVAGGALAGGIAGAVGAALWATAAPSPQVVGWLAVFVCLSAALLDASGRRLPGVRRQVDDDWMRRYRGWVYGAGFGFQLGLGVVTIVTTAAVYATFAMAALTGAVTTAAMVGAGFGGARAATLLASSRVSDPGGLRLLHRRLAAVAPYARIATIGTLTAIAFLVIGTG